MPNNGYSADILDLNIFNMVYTMNPEILAWMTPLFHFIVIFIMVYVYAVVCQCRNRSGRDKLKITFFITSVISSLLVAFIFLVIIPNI